MNKDIKQEITTTRAGLFITSTYSCSTTGTNGTPSTVVLVSGLTLPTNKLNDKYIHMTDIVPPPVVPPDAGYIPEPGNYLILSHYSINNTTYFTVQHNFTNTFTINCTLDDEIILYNKLTDIINYLNTVTTSQFINNKMPSYNDYFVKYNELIEEFTNFINNYKIKTDMHTKIGNLTNYTELDTPSQVVTSQQIDTFLITTQNNIGLINTILSENEAYFKRLKTLMSDIKISDQKVNDEVYLNYYDSRESSSKILIDELYNNFVSDGKIGYSNKIQEKLEYIKI